MPRTLLRLLHVNLAIAICLAHASFRCLKVMLYGTIRNDALSATQRCNAWTTRSIYEGRGLRFPCHGRTGEVNNKLFIIRLFLLWTLVCDRLKPTTGQLHLNEFYTWARVTVRWHWSGDTVFDSCQSTVTWMSIRMSTRCLEHPASNPGHYKIEDSQSKRVYYCSHII